MQDQYAAMVMAATNFTTGGEYGHYSLQQQGPYSSQRGFYSNGGSGTSIGCPVLTHQQLNMLQQPPSPAASFSSGCGTPTITMTSAKRYRHNPYASEPSTPTNSNPIHNNVVQPSQHYYGGGPCSLPSSSLNSSSDVSYASFNTYPPQQPAPVYAPESMFEGQYPAAHSVTESFSSVVGNVCQHACTPRGRHLLISTMRLQHLDKIQCIFDELAPNVSLLSLDANACHVVRNLIELVSEAQLAVLVSYLTPSSILEMAVSTQNTRRVLQSLFEKNRSSLLDPVVRVIAEDVCRLALTQQGCILVMRMLENCLPHQTKWLIHWLAPILSTLTMDPYGNYVVQTILQTVTEPDVLSTLIRTAFDGHWLILSCNKFASNVMEKVIKSCLKRETRQMLLRELIYESSALTCLMQDGFGNFVLQALIESSPSAEEFRVVSELVRPLLHTSPFGHKIEARLAGRGKKKVIDDFEGFS